MIEIVYFDNQFYLHIKTIFFTFKCNFFYIYITSWPHINFITNQTHILTKSQTKKWQFNIIQLAELHRSSFSPNAAFYGVFGTFSHIFVGVHIRIIPTKRWRAISLLADITFHFLRFISDRSIGDFQRPPKSPDCADFDYCQIELLSISSFSV